MTTTIHIQGILLDDMSATLWDKADGWTDGVGEIAGCASSLLLSSVAHGGGRQMDCG